MPASISRTPEGERMIAALPAEPLARMQSSRDITFQVAFRRTAVADAAALPSRTTERRMRRYCEREAVDGVDKFCEQFLWLLVRLVCGEARFSHLMLAQPQRSPRAWLLDNGCHYFDRVRLRRRLQFAITQRLISCVLHV